MSAHAIGVDAYTLGWVGVELHDGVFGRAVLASTLYEIVAGSSGAAVVGVGMPLRMLPDRFRAADTAVADLLGSQGSSVLRVPPRAAWTAHDFAAADQLCRELTGSPFSRQSWAVRSKLLEANVLWRRHPKLLVEAHPELSFRTMAGNA